MLGNRLRHRIPLPKQWPSRVRSGVLHAISLAHYSLTFTRSWAANSINARIRAGEQPPPPGAGPAPGRDAHQGQPHAAHSRSAPAALPAHCAAGHPRAQGHPGLDGATLARDHSHGRVVDGLFGRRLPAFPRPERRARQQVPRLRRLRRPAAEGALSQDGQGQDRQVLCHAGLHLGSTTVQRMLVDRSHPFLQIGPWPPMAKMSARRPVRRGRKRNRRQRQQTTSRNNVQPAGAGG